MQPEAGKPRTLHFGTVYKYGMGEFGFTFFNSLVAYYLLYYMTDIALIPMAVAGVLYSALQWVEALTSIGAGVLIDNTRLKGGRYRPWLLIGSIVCGTALFAASNMQQLALNMGASAGKAGAARPPR